MLMETEGTGGTKCGFMREVGWHQRIAALATRPRNRPTQQVVLRRHAGFVKSRVQCGRARFNIPPEADGYAAAQLQTIT